MNTFDWIKRAQDAEERLRLEAGWTAQLKARAEAAEAALAEERAEVARMEAVCDSYAIENQQFHDRFTAAEAAAIDARGDAAHALHQLAEAKRQLHELSIKYTVALNRSRKRGEALQACIREMEDAAGAFDYGDALELARAALDSQKPLTGPGAKPLSEMTREELSKVYPRE